MPVQNKNWKPLRLNLQHFAVEDDQGASQDSTGDENWVLNL
ncbi:hypothetical protein [Oceanobacillus sp. CF4.6]